MIKIMFFNDLSRDCIGVRLHLGIYVFPSCQLWSVLENCAETNNDFYDGSQGSYDTDVTIRVLNEDDKWRVFGFE